MNIGLPVFSMERMYCIAAFISTVVCAVFYFVFASTGEYDWVPDWFAHNAATLLEKYHTPFSPSPAMICIAWTCTSLTTMVAQLYLYFTLPNEVFFPGVFHLSWILGANITYALTFIYDWELHVLNFFLYGLKLSLLVIQVISVVEVYFEKAHKYSDNFRWGLQRIVLDSVVLLATYTGGIYPMMAILAFGWNYSANFDVPQPREFISYQSAETIAIVIFVTQQVAWLLIDFVLYPRKASIIRSAYPTYMFCNFGFFLSNYDSDKGLDRNNIVCLVMGLTSMAAYCLRNKIKWLYVDYKKKKAL